MGRLVGADGPTIEADQNRDSLGRFVGVGDSGSRHWMVNGIDGRQCRARQAFLAAMWCLPCRSIHQTPTGKHRKMQSQEGALYWLIARWVTAEMLSLLLSKFLASSSGHGPFCDFSALNVWL